MYASSSTLSSIDEHSYGSETIKTVVENLVMSKFGKQFNWRLTKSMQRMNGSTIFSKLASKSTVNTCNLSALLSRANSKTQVAEEEYFGSLDEESVGQRKSSTRSDYYSLDYSFDSMNESVYEQLFILEKNREQILKARKCHELLPKNQDFTLQRIEAERLLLITDIKTKLLQQPENMECDVDSFGTIELSRVHFWSESYHPIEQYFICLLISEKEVISSGVCKMKSNGAVFFSKKFILEFLQPNFQFKLQVYSIFPKDFKKSHNSFFCAVRNNAGMFEKSLFYLWEEADLTLADIRGKSNLEIRQEMGVITACVKSRVDLHGLTLSGFVDVSFKDQDSFSWSKEWCVLTESILRCYNYPPAVQENATITHLINLIYCDEIQVLTKDECPKNWSILLKMRKNRIILAFENQEQFQHWKKNLDFVMEQIKIWG